MYANKSMLDIFSTTYSTFFSILFDLICFFVIGFCLFYFLFFVYFLFASLLPSSARVSHGGQLHDPEAKTWPGKLRGTARSIQPFFMHFICWFVYSSTSIVCLFVCWKNTSHWNVLNVFLMICFISMSVWVSFEHTIAFFFFLFFLFATIKHKTQPIKEMEQRYRRVTVSLHTEFHIRNTLRVTLRM